MLVMLPEMEISLKKIKHYTVKLNLALVVDFQVKDICRVYF